MTTNKQRFDEASKDWDKSDFRLSLAKNITDKILENIPLTQNDVVMDFGCGTGLVGLNIAPFVQKLIGADISSAMLENFEEKAKASKLTNVESLQLHENSDLCAGELDVIVSAMALHHIKDPMAQFQKFSQALKGGGILAIADLAKEDGTFHSDNTGVFHFGFGIGEWNDFFLDSGFETPQIILAHTASRGVKNYDIMLCFARKD